MNSRPPDREEHTDAERSLRDAWSQASAEQPPAPLDAAILAAARRAVAPERAPAPRHRRPWHARWSAFAAAAAVAGLAFLLLPLMPREPRPNVAVQEARPVTSPPAESAAKASAPAATADAAPQSRRNEAPPSALDAAEETVPAAPPPPVAGSAPSVDSRPVAAPAPAETDAVERRAETATTRAAERAGGAASSVSAEGAAVAPRRDAADADLPGTVARIVALYERGEFDAAAEELRALRTERPDADQQLPREMQAWAETVR